MDDLRVTVEPERIVTSTLILRSRSAEDAHGAFEIYANPGSAEAIGMRSLCVTSSRCGNCWVSGICSRLRVHCRRACGQWRWPMTASSSVARRYFPSVRAIPSL